jgi:hypothetical protein
MGLLSGRAYSREQYIRIWKAHVADMTTLMYAAGLTKEEIDKHSTEMLRWVGMAAYRQTFSDEPQK